MNSETTRIADQLRRAFRGEAWHGPSLLDLLAEVSPEQARARPMRSVHSIWELVLHIDVYVRAAFDATQGTPMPKLFGTERDWPSLTTDSAEGWFDAQDKLFEDAEKLAQAIEKFDEAKLRDAVPGRSYDFYYLFHGIVQHSLYHGGQIAILKKAVTDS
jgi:uncharacterized damage-inducible protein DinB